MVLHRSRLCPATTIIHPHPAVDRAHGFAVQVSRAEQRPGAISEVDLIPTTSLQRTTTRNILDYLERLYHDCKRPLHSSNRFNSLSPLANPNEAPAIACLVCLVKVVVPPPD